MAQTSKAYIDDLLEMSELPDTSNCQSEIPQFYAGCNILITGGTGFLGILLIEKLLRCCPDIGNIYVTMRTKKGKSLEQRLKEHLDSIVYERLKKEKPDFNNKVIVIEADLNLIDFGLSSENRERLLNTNIIFHMGATVRFNESIRVAVNINVRGTKQLLLFAKQMPNLKAFVHTSTAFSYCVHKFIEEKHYSPPMETDKILTLVDILDDERLEHFTPILMGKWPNTYVFTKAIAEHTVRQYGTGIPICIVRPSIVTSTAKEPIGGWVNNVYGAVGIVVGSAVGLLRSVHCIPENVAEIVPADYVISHIIAASWETAKRRNIPLSIENVNPDVPEIERVPIYNYVSACQNPITWQRFMKLNEIHGMQVPSTYVMWYYMLFLNRYKFVHDVCVIFLHLIPALIFDTLMFLTGRKPMLWKAYKKINTFNSVLSYFSSQQWRFCNDAVVKLWDSMNQADRQIFDFNMDNLEWEPYIKQMIPGLRIYLVNDPMETIEKGKAKYRKLKVAHYTLLAVFAILLLWGVISLIIRIIPLFL